LSSVTALVACTLGALTNAACTDTTLLAGLEGTLAGPVYWPVELIVPTVALPPATPLTDHATDVFEVPVTAVENWVGGSPGRTVAVAGVTTMLACGAGALPDCEQPITQKAIKKQKDEYKKRVDT
jgi:hypothetical protein